MAVTRLSGGITPANGSDPRTFPAIWNATADDIEAAESAIAAIEAWDLEDINDVTIATPLDGEVLTYDNGDWVNQALPTPTPPAILQVVSTAKTDTFSTTSTSFVDVTNLSLTITPSATSSKILLTAYVPMSWSNIPAAAAVIRFSGGNSGNFVGDAASNRTRGAATSGVRPTDNFQFLVYNATPVYLDSPNTTSAITYKIQILTPAGTVYVNRNGDDTDSASNARVAASITAMEVAV